MFCCCCLEVTVEVNQNAAVSSAAAGGLIQTTEGKRSTRIATQTRNDGQVGESAVRLGRRTNVGKDCLCAVFIPIKD